MSSQLTSINRNGKVVCLFLGGAWAPFPNSLVIEPRLLTEWEGYTGKYLTCDRWVSTLLHSVWGNDVSIVDRWKRRLLKTVTKKASYTVAFISAFGRISVNSWKQNKNAWVSEIILFHFRWEKTDTLKTHLCGRGLTVTCYVIRLRKPPSQLPFTAEMLVTTQTEAAAASPRSDSTLSAPHSTQNSPKPARYVPARNNLKSMANFVLRYRTSYLFTYLLSEVSKIIYFIFLNI